MNIPAWQDGAFDFGITQNIRIRGQRARKTVSTEGDTGHCIACDARAKHILKAHVAFSSESGMLKGAMNTTPLL
jgi:hypothetical protein